MPIACARCGTQNPDGNAFCQACGAPLAAAAMPPGGAAAPGPPPGAPPPPPAYPGGGYQSPYYAPAAGGPQQPVHRTPWVLIVGLIVGLIVIMSGCGIVVAVVGVNKAQTNNAGILPKPTPATTPTPVVQPSPVASPKTSPKASPKATPSPTGGGGSKTVSNAGVSVQVPAGWTVANKDDQSISLVPPSNDGSVTVGAGPSNPPATAQQNKDTLDKFFTNKYPDTKNCPGSQTNTGTISGASGIFWELCFTLTSSGSSFQAGAPLFAGANQDGTNYFVILLITKADNMDNFINEATPILESIQWKVAT